MANEIIVAEPGGQVSLPMTKAAVLDRVSMIQKIMADPAIMKEGIHYGPPNGKKANDEADDDKKLRPVLLQPGAEKLMMTFRLAADFPETKKIIGDDGSIIYEVKCAITDQMTGAFLGSEWGTCSSNEEKYHWKRCYIQGEFDAAPESGKRLKWRQSYRDKSEYTETQIRVNPADVANTVLAIACKRAKVRAVRAACAASDIFDVNIEDLPEDLRPGYDEDETERRQPKPSEAMNRRQNPGTANAKPAQTQPAATTTRPAAPAGTPGAFIITFGKNQGKTLAEVGERSASWYAENAREEDLKAAAAAYIASLHDEPSAPAAPAPGDDNAVPPDDMPDIEDPFPDS